MSLAVALPEDPEAVHSAVLATSTAPGLTCIYMFACTLSCWYHECRIAHHLLGSMPRYIAVVLAG